MSRIKCLIVAIMIDGAGWFANDAWNPNYNNSSFNYGFRFLPQHWGLFLFSSVFWVVGLELMRRWSRQQ